MKIMVAYDPSEEADHLMDLAKKQAHSFGAEVHLVTSMSKGDEDHLKQIKFNESALEKTKQDFLDDGLRCESHLLIRASDAGRDLVEFAEEHGVDEIVIGVHQRSQLEKLVFGSTARYVILYAPCPVLCTR